MMYVSMSSIASFIRCPRQFEILWEKGIQDDKPKSEALEKGTLIHKYFEYYLKGKMNELDWSTDEGKVVSAYLFHNPIQQRPLMVEETLKLQVRDNVTLTFTPDVLFETEHSIEPWDWKSFTKLRTLDTQLNLQTRTYLAGVWKRFPGKRIYKFVHQYVRTTPPDVPKDKTGGCWAPHECYVSQPTILNEEQLQQAWEMVEFWIDKILTYERERRPIGGSDMSSCVKCPVYGICTQQLDGYTNYSNTKPNERGTLISPRR